MSTPINSSPWAVNDEHEKTLRKFIDPVQTNARLVLDLLHNVIKIHASFDSVNKGFKTYKLIAATAEFKTFEEAVEDLIHPTHKVPTKKAHSFGHAAALNFLGYEIEGSVASQKKKAKPKTLSLPEQYEQCEAIVRHARALSTLIADPELAAECYLPFLESDNCNLPAGGMIQLYEIRAKLQQLASLSPEPGQPVRTAITAPKAVSPWRIAQG